MTGGYTERDRARHYGGTVARSRCIVCLLGMGASHGRSDVDWKMPLSAEPDDRTRARFRFERNEETGNLKLVDFDTTNLPWPRRGGN